MTSVPGSREAHSEAAEKEKRCGGDRQHKPQSDVDILVEVSDALGKIREVAQGSCDKLLLYVIDMAILQACGEILSSELKFTNNIDLDL